MRERGITDERRDELLLAEKLTEADLAGAIGALPTGVRAALARGPVGYRYACRVCDAFRSCDLTKGLRPEDPRWMVFNYHEVPKLRMRSARDQWTGPCATEVYERCQTIYRLAAA